MCHIPLLLPLGLVLVEINFSQAEERGKTDRPSLCARVDGYDMKWIFHPLLPSIRSCHGPMGLMPFPEAVFGGTKFGENIKKGTLPLDMLDFGGKK